jgi:hypothetical protein
VLGRAVAASYWSGLWRGAGPERNLAVCALAPETSHRTQQVCWPCNLWARDRLAPEHGPDQCLTILEVMNIVMGTLDASKIFSGFTGPTIA